MQFLGWGGGRLITALVASMVAAACGGASEPTGGPPDPGPSDGLIRLEEVATIGCETCPPLEQISVFAMVLDADGLIWSVDRYAPHMRVFRTNGELVAAFGPGGEGPGDFRSGPMESMLTGHAVLAVGGGRVLVHQWFPPAYVGFDVEGNVTRHLPILIPDALTQSSHLLVRDPTGPRVFALSIRSGPGGDDEPFIVHRFDIGDESVSRVEIATGSQVFPGAGRAADPYTRRWFSMAVAPDGTLAIGDSLAYQVVRMDGDGNVIGSFSHDAERPLRSEDSLFSLRIAARRKGESEDSVDVHDVHFSDKALEFDDSGRLWVLRNRPTRELSFDVFAPDGRFLQQLDVSYQLSFSPYGVRGAVPAFSLSGGYLAAPVVGPDDEDRIVVWRVIDE